MPNGNCDPNGGISIEMSNEVKLGDLKKALSISPKITLGWPSWMSDDDTSGHFYLYGKFKPGRRYTVAINAAALPVRASGTGTGVVAAVGATPLSGGAAPSSVDPSGTRFEWARATGQAGGFFYFENHQDILVVTGFQAKFSGLGASPIPLRVAVVNLDGGLEPVAGTDISVKDAEVDSGYPEFSLAGIDGIPLLPYQALLVTCAAVGSVRVTVQRQRRYPYA
jgi:hypothetical protein